MNSVNNKKVSALTLGCKVNAYDTDAMLSLFAAAGYHIVDFESPEGADIVIINTCTVTNLGNKKSRQMIRKAKQLNPDAYIIVAGCYAQVAPDEVQKIPGVDLVLGTKDRTQIVSLVEARKDKTGVYTNVSNIMNEHIFEPLSTANMQKHTRAFLKIQDGCDRFCSYCIIPFARGPVRSRPLNEVILELENLRNAGYREIVLTGIHVASYGKDVKDYSLRDVLAAANDIEGIERIRLSSIDPDFMNLNNIQFLHTLPKLCNHFHLSLQSGCQKTLAAMNRHYTVDQFRTSVQQIREFFPTAALTTDVIAGFPGETEDDFLESYDFCKEIGFAKLHVFPYSPKKGTKAAGMAQQVPKEVKDHRSKQLTLLSNELNKQFRQDNTGCVHSVLFESSTSDGHYLGHTRNYINVYVESNESLINKILKVRCAALKNDGLYGTVMLQNDDI